MRSETETSGKRDQDKPVESENKQEVPVEVWVRPSADNPYLKQIDNTFKIVTAIIQKEVKDLTKKIFKAKKVMDG